MKRDHPDTGPIEEIEWHIVEGPDGRSVWRRKGDDRPPPQQGFGGFSGGWLGTYGSLLSSYGKFVKTSDWVGPPLVVVKTHYVFKLGVFPIIAPLGQFIKKYLDDSGIPDATNICIFSLENGKVFVVYSTEKPHDPKHSLMKQRIVKGEHRAYLLSKYESYIIYKETETQ